MHTSSQRSNADIRLVLVIDDDARIRTMLRLLLEDAGFEVVEESSGTRAVQAAADAGADLVLCDLFMPDVDGLEVIQALRRAHPSVPIVAISGGGFNGAVDMLSAARLLGASAILQKPFTHQTLLATIDRVTRVA